MEFLSEKAVALWGPFAFVVIILLVGIVSVVKYFMMRQKHWDAMDRERNQEFVLVAKQFNETAKDFSTNVAVVTGVLHELKSLVSNVNENVIRMNARSDG